MVSADFGGWSGSGYQRRKLLDAFFPTNLPPLTPLGCALFLPVAARGLSSSDEDMTRVFVAGQQCAGNNERRGRLSIEVWTYARDRVDAKCRRPRERAW